MGQVGSSLAKCFFREPALSHILNRTDNLGTPVAIYFLYIFKLIAFTIGAILVISTTKGLGSLSNLGDWWTEPIVFQKFAVWTLLWEILGLGAGSMPLSFRFNPPIGGPLYWLRPGRIRLPPWPDKVPPRRPVRHASFEGGRAALQKLIELPLIPGEDGTPRPFLCPLADDAAEIFDQWRREHSEAEVSGSLASAFGKAPGHLLRLALVLEHLWWCAKTSIAMPPNRISKAAVLAAAGLVDDYLKPMAERVFGDAALPEGDRIAATVARWILRERPAVLNARDLRRKARLPGLREAEKVKLALNVLVEADWLRPAFGRAGDSTGRQREDYQINPRLYEGGDGK